MTRSQVFKTGLLTRAARGVESEKTPEFNNPLAERRWERRLPLWAADERRRALKWKGM